MAQRKSPPPGKPAVKKGPSRPAGKPAGATGGPAKSGVGVAKSPDRRSTGANRSPTRRTNKKKSIVNQKQKPWGLIATTVAVVLFAAAVVAVVVATHKSGSSGGTDKNDPYRQPALPAAMAIKGVTYKVEPNHTHVDGTVNYDASPPVGGDHSPYWANCNGVVYDTQLANENAVHMLEHGAIWITYNPQTLPKSELPKLESYVRGQSRVAMTPYAGLKTPISLQAWGYQLFLNSASDPRIAQFISTLEYNPKTTPEPTAGCTDPYFDAKKSTPGHPLG
jgi:hypothetical protein